MTGRNGTIDLLRYVAAIGIVLFHTKAPFAQIGYAALPLFVMLLAFFSVPTDQSVRKLGRRLIGLLWIWLGWSAIYAGLKIAQAVMTGAPISSEFAPWMLLAGPSLHLWFLPFAGVVTVVGHLLARVRTAVSGDSARAGMALAALVAVLVASIAAALLARQQVAHAIPLAQWVHAWPAAALGFLLVVLRPVIAPGRTAALMLLILVALNVTARATDLGMASQDLMLAVLFFAVATAIPLPATRLSSQMRGLSLNVYLVHPAVLALLLQTGVMAPASAAIFWLTALISTGLGLLLARVGSFGAARRRALADASVLDHT